MHGQSEGADVKLLEVSWLVFTGGAQIIVSSFESILGGLFTRLQSLFLSLFLFLFFFYDRNLVAWYYQGLSTTLGLQEGSQCITMLARSVDCLVGTCTCTLGTILHASIRGGGSSQVFGGGAQLINYI